MRLEPSSISLLMSFLPLTPRFLLGGQSPEVADPGWVTLAIQRGCWGTAAFKEEAHLAAKSLVLGPGWSRIRF